MELADVFLPEVIEVIIAAGIADDEVLPGLLLRPGPKIVVLELGEVLRDKILNEATEVTLGHWSASKRTTRTLRVRGPSNSAR